MASVCYLVTARSFHKGSIQKSLTPADADATQTANGNTGLEGIDFFFPDFCFSTFGALGWNTRNTLNSILQNHNPP
jgi:hypothetical protein